VVSALARGGLRRDLRAIADLVHPDTARVFDYGVTDEGDWFYAMEYVPGETRAAVVGCDGPMAADRVARVSAQTARALGEAHARGVVHRDIKPENLMLTTLGREVDFVKVLDFGVAKLVSARDTHVTSPLTRDGAVIGTPLFISPEQGSGEAVDAREVAARPRRPR
jgi:serine/threonine protein kinase